MASRRSETKPGHATAVAVATIIFRSGSLALAVQMLLLFATPLPLRCTHTKLLTRASRSPSIYPRDCGAFCSGISHKKGTAVPRLVNGDPQIQLLNDLKQIEGLPLPFQTFLNPSLALCTLCVSASNVPNVMMLTAPTLEPPQTLCSP